MNTKHSILLFISLTFFSVIIYTVSKEYLKLKFFTPSSCNENESCVRFCCFNSSCKNKEELKSIKIINATELSKNYKILEGESCEQMHSHDIWSFKKNGYLIDAENHVYNWNEYCYFHTQDFILTCVPVNIIENLKTIFPYLMLSSVPFLIITLFIYGFISELRTNHGKCIMGYVSSLILMYTSLSIIGIENHNLLQNYNKTCKSLGYIFMSSIWMCFFWLNVMCFDVWNSIRSSTPASAQCRNSTKTFIKYCLYAFGVPVFISFVIILLNELEVISEDWQTGIGKYSCSISEPINDNSDEAYERSLRAQKLYLYGPISFFLFINIGFYITTAYTIFDIQNQTNAFNKDGNIKHTKKEKGRFALYIRLFLLMGLPWSIEILSWLFESEVTYIVSIINCMQGVVIFVMFVMHKRILQYLKKKKNPTFNTQSTALRPLKSRIQSKESLA